LRTESSSQVQKVEEGKKKGVRGGASDNETSCGCLQPWWIGNGGGSERIVPRCQENCKPWGGKPSPPRGKLPWPEINSNRAIKGSSGRGENLTLMRRNTKTGLKGNRVVPLERVENWGGFTGREAVMGENSKNLAKGSVGVWG